MAAAAAHEPSEQHTDIATAVAATAAATLAPPAGDAARYVLALQRRAGNAATARLITRTRARRLARGIDPPGTGWDGLQGDPLPRKLTPEMEKITSNFRKFLEGSRNDRGLWSRQAGNLTNAFNGTAVERATLYGELQRQMIQVHRNWFAFYQVAADGSHVFLSNPQVARTFIVAADGVCYAGPQSALTKVDGKIRIDFKALTRLPSGTPGTGGAPPAGGGAAPAEGAPGTKPPTAAPKPGAVEPAPGAAPKPGTGVKPPTGARGAVRPRPSLAGGLRAVRSIGIQMIVLYIIGKLLAAAEQERVEKLFETTVDPEVAKLMPAAQAQAEQLGEDDPFAMVYANISLDITYRGSRWRGGTVSEAVEKAVVHKVVAGRDRVESQETLSDVEALALFSTSIPFTKVVRLTYSVPLTFDLELADRVAWTAEVNASKGQTARSAIKGRGWTLDQRRQFVAAYLRRTADDAARAGLHSDALTLQAELDLEQRFGLASVLSARSAAEQGISARDAAARTHWSSDQQRANFVEAYVEITRNVAAWKALHDDAAAYLAELREAIAAAARGPFGSLLLDEPPMTDEQAIRDWLYAPH